MPITVSQKKRGRPATGVTPRVGVRFPEATLRRVDGYADAQGVDRSEAIRRLVDVGLDHATDGDSDHPSTKVPPITGDEDTI